MGRDLAQACRDHYSKPVVLALWVLCELAIAACDLAEVVGSAIGLQLLFGIPLVWGCIITCLDVLAVLYLQNKGFRYVEALVITLIATIGGVFRRGVDVRQAESDRCRYGLCAQRGDTERSEYARREHWHPGRDRNASQLHLDSSIVQTRRFERTPEGRREAIKFATIDSSFALMFALFINAAILILSAAVFHWSGHHDVAEIQDAYRLLSPTLGVTVASTLFAVALLASGQNSTFTETWRARLSWRAS